MSNTVPCFVCSVPVRPPEEYQPPTLCNHCFNTHRALPQCPDEFNLAIEKLKEYRKLTCKNKAWENV